MYGGISITWIELEVPSHFHLSPSLLGWQDEEEEERRRESLADHERKAKERAAEAARACLLPTCILCLAPQCCYPSSPLPLVDLNEVPIHHPLFAGRPSSNGRSSKR
jgi:hypothetical protein